MALGRIVSHRAQSALHARGRELPRRRLWDCRFVEKGQLLAELPPPSARTSELCPASAPPAAKTGTRTHTALERTLRFQPDFAQL